MDTNDLIELGLDENLDNDEDDLTAAEILKSMENIWLNEKLAPELLPHKIETVECLYLQIQEMEKNIKRLPVTDIRRCAHELELKRIKFLLTSYLRTRLLKIETYSQDIKQQEEFRRENDEESYLSNAETVFLTSFKNMNDKFMRESLQFLPSYVQDESKEHPMKPNLNSFVFFQSKKAVNGVIVDNSNIQDDVVDIEEGSKMIMCYNSVRDLLRNDDIQLI